MISPFFGTRHDPLHSPIHPFRYSGALRDCLRPERVFGLPDHRKAILRPKSSLAGYLDHSLGFGGNRDN